MKRLLALLIVLLAAPVDPARAAGHAHIVDDAEVETPGTCHVELWVSVYMLGEGYGNAAPGCTSKKIPWLEFGFAYSNYWDQAIAAPLFGPQVKINFRSSETTAVGIGIGLNAGVNLKTGDLGLGQAYLLMTIPINKDVRLNVNYGWSYLSDSEIPNAAFYGAQIEANVTKDLLLMVEMFGRAPGELGAQFGLRYTPNQGFIDFDLLVGNQFDQIGSRSITFGMTLRF